MPIETNILKKFLNPYFIETGSHIGNGIQSAIDCGFDNIISIELADKYYNLLDGHHSGDDTAWGIHNDPIFEELDIISTHNIKTHIILVDDIRGMDKNKLIEKILSINKNYDISYEDGYIENDILVAMIK